MDSASSDSTNQRMVESMDAEPTDTESRVVQVVPTRILAPSLSSYVTKLLDNILPIVIYQPVIH